jgi:hypothetical protein
MQGNKLKKDKGKADKAREGKFRKQGKSFVMDLSLLVRFLLFPSSDPKEKDRSHQGGLFVDRSFSFRLPSHRNQIG